jgi:hypothetical protein
LAEKGEIEMRGIRVALCASLLAIPLQAAGPLTAHASAPDNDTVACVASGYLTTTPASVDLEDFVIWLTLSCTGSGDDQGSWSVYLHGQMSPGFCAGGEGLANVSGSGPDGSLYGNVQLAMGATSLQIAGAWSDSDPAGEAFQATLTATSTSGIPCTSQNTTENLNGDAAIADQSPPPDFVGCTFVGAENYTPGITAGLAPHQLDATASMNCQNPASDDKGNWQLNYSGIVTADCALSMSTGYLAITGGGGPEGAPGGKLSYERVGTMVYMSGEVDTTNDAHAIAVWGAWRPGLGNCATIPVQGGGITGTAGMQEPVTSVS